MEHHYTSEDNDDSGTKRRAININRKDREAAANAYN
jgi:hypothetical protein